MHNLRCSVPREAPGTLAFRGNKQRIWDLRMRNYKLPVRAVGWATDRESEPKDYDFSSAPKKNIFRSTYNQIGYYDKNWHIPKPTTQELQECAVKPKYSKCRKPERDLCRILLTRQSVDRAKENVIPSDKHKVYLLSTYKSDYKRRQQVKEESPQENRWEKLVEAGAFRRCKPGAQNGIQKWIDFHPRCPFLDMKQEIAQLKSHKQDVKNSRIENNKQIASNSEEVEVP